MSFLWLKRKSRLRDLLNSQGDEDTDGLALDRLLHGQSVIGKTSRTAEIDAIRFQDSDLGLVGTLERGQFGLIDVVTCKLDGRIYVRKSIEKQFALRTRDQCSPQFERDVLLQALKTNSKWAPHLLCAFQSPTHVNLVMNYAEGGNLWDVLQSSPHDGKILEQDLMWWAPQIVSAIDWCHSQGFVHRDIKPHNFVLTSESHILLIDFGSAAPLLPPEPDGSRRLPRRYCLVPCGTCDYISPEILKAHEDALVALEMDEEDEVNSRGSANSEGYGMETDWWSLGAMLYEMAYGVAPFFASDIRRTYLKIMDHRTSLRFPRAVPISVRLQDLLRRLLTDAELRLGRCDISEITEHPVFNGVDWANLSTHPPPPGLHLPQFTYAGPVAQTESLDEESHSRPFAFSALFQSSPGSVPALSILQATPSPVTRSTSGEASFIGFSWGPTEDAFPHLPAQESRDLSYSAAVAGADTPRPLRVPSTRASPNLMFHPPSTPHPFTTPNRRSALTLTLPRASTVRRTATTTTQRAVSDREAMKQLVDCVGMSARKKVLDSGRKPRVLIPPSSMIMKELRLRPAPPAVPPPLALGASSGTEDTDSEGGGPPSPSPTPRPGSAMSRRSGTPNTMTMTFSNIQTGVLSGLRSGEVTSIASPTFETSTFEDLEEKHAEIMGNILAIQRRLDDVSVLVERRRDNTN